MGFTKPDFPDVDPDEFLAKPLMERMRILALNWAENGFGSPKMVHTVYIVKLVFFYALGAILVATLTSGLPAFWHVSGWWNQPIVYEKAILWTVLLEAIGVAGSWGPLAGKVKPMTGGILFWARPGTIRLRPWKWVPFTAGDRRTRFDVALYATLLISVAIALFSPGVHSDSLSAVMPNNTSGVVNPALLVAPIVLLVAMGLRDKTIFLACAWRAVLACAGHLRGVPVRQYDHRSQAVDRGGVGRRRGVEVRQALLQRRAADGQQQPVATVQIPQACALPRLPARSAAVTRRRLDGPRRGHHGGDHRPAGAAVLAVAVAHRAGRDTDGRFPPVHRLDVPDRGSAGMERAVRLRHRLPVPGLPDLARLCGRPTCRRRG